MTRLLIKGRQNFRHPQGARAVVGAYPTAPVESRCRASGKPKEMRGLAEGDPAPPSRRSGADAAPVAPFQKVMTSCEAILKPG